MFCISYGFQWRQYRRYNISYMKFGIPASDQRYLKYFFWPLVVQTLLEITGFALFRSQGSAVKFPHWRFRNTVFSSTILAATTALFLWLTYP